MIKLPNSGSDKIQKFRFPKHFKHKSWKLSEISLIFLGKFQVLKEHFLPENSQFKGNGEIFYSPRPLRRPPSPLFFTGLPFPSSSRPPAGKIRIFIYHGFQPMSGPVVRDQAALQYNSYKAVVSNKTRFWENLFQNRNYNYHYHDYIFK